MNETINTANIDAVHRNTNYFFETGVKEAQKQLKSLITGDCQ
jgi:hypothetical protein